MSLSTSIAAFSALVFATGAVACAQSAAPAQRDPAYGKHAMAFEPNRGQVAAPAQFLAHGSNYSVLLAPAQATLMVHHEQGTATQRLRAQRTGKPLPSTSRAIRMTLAGANAAAPISGQNALPGYVNYLSGADRTKDRTGIPTFAAARVEKPYNGVDLLYYGTDNHLEYDFLLAPQADPAQIKLHFSGARPVLAADGALHLQSGSKPSATDLSFLKPVVYQQLAGKRTPVDGSFAVAKNGEVSFHLGTYDHSQQLVIDPILSYASYFGGSNAGGTSGEDEINASALNTNNQLYAVGQTYSYDLPATTGEFQPINNQSGKNVGGGRDAFITKFSADGSAVLWTTYLGGTGDDTALGVAVNAADQPVVVGYTTSCGFGPGPGQAAFTPIVFPFTQNAVQALCAPSGGNDANGKPIEVNGGGANAFVSRLSSDGKTLLYGTFLGGSNNSYDYAAAVALDSANNIYVVGTTGNTVYLVPQPGVTNYSPVPGYAITGTGSGTGYGVADFPTTANAYERAYSYAQANAFCNTSYCTGPAFESSFLSVLSSSGTTLLYSTVLTPPNTGGCGNGDCDTYTNTVAVGPNNLVYVGGNTNSLSLPVTPNAFAPACTARRATDCPRTGFLYAIDISKAGAASLVFSTYINGSSAGVDSNGNNLAPTSEVDGVTADSQGNVVLTGYTNANNFPTTSGAFQTTCPLFNDGNANSKRCNTAMYLTKLTPAGATLWSTLYGPTNPSDGGLQTGGNVRLDANNNVFATFYGGSNSFPLKNAFSTNGGNDAHLIEFNPTASTLLMSTALGTGGGINLNNSLSLDSNLNAYFSGAQAPNTYGGTYFPVTPNAFQKTLLGNADGFVVKIITQQQPTATTLTVSPTGQLSPTQSVTLTAAVASTSTLTGIPTTPTGTVSFLNGTTVLGTGTITAGKATYTGTLPTGNDSITAVYAGDSGFNGSTSAATVVTVSSAVATTTSLVVSPATATSGQTVTLTSTTLAGTAPATAGSVTFTAGTMTLGTATIGANGVATTTITPAVGTYTVVANYTGTYSGTNLNGTGNSVSASQTLTVGKATATVAVSASTALAPVGGSVTFTARVATTTGTPTGTVNFLNGTTVLGTGTLAAGVATFTSTTLPAGTYVVSASYLGDTNFAAATSTTSAPVVIRTPAATNLMLASSALTAPIKTTITLTATLTTQATGTPSGSVTFYSGTTVLGTATITSNLATFTGTLPAGTSTLTAVYSGDTLFATSTSNAITEAITNPTLSVSATPNPLIIQHGHSGTLTLTLTPSGGFAGTVTFGCGNIPQYVTCAFAPTSLVFTAASSAAQTDILTIYTNTQLTASLSKPGTFDLTSLATLLWLPGSALALFGLRRKGTRQHVKSLLMLALVVSGLGIAGSLSGCAGNNNFNSATPGTYVVPLSITGTDGSVETVNASITIQ